MQAEDAPPVTLNFEGGIVETPNLLWRNDYFTDNLAVEPVGPGTRTSGYGAGSARVDFGVGRDGRATVRAGLTTNGLPAGLQIIGPKYRDDLVLQAAYGFEQMRPWNEEWPTVDC